MPLIIGIKDSEKADEMFTKEEQGFLAGMNLGMMCMAAGIGDIEGEYGYSISVDEAMERFAIMNKYYGCKDDDTLVVYLEDKEFVQRMADAGWGCNVNNESAAEFIFNMKSRAFDKLTGRMTLKHTRSGWESWSKVEAKLDRVKEVIYYHLNGEHQWMDTAIGELIYAFQEELLGQEMFDKYLHWDDDAHKCVLVDELPEE